MKNAYEILAIKNRGESIYIVNAENAKQAREWFFENGPDVDDVYVSLYEPGFFEKRNFKEFTVPNGWKPTLPEELNTYVEFCERRANRNEISDPQRVILGADYDMLDFLTDNCTDNHDPEHWEQDDDNDRVFWELDQFGDRTENYIEITETYKTAEHYGFVKWCGETHCEKPEPYFPSDDACETNYEDEDCSPEM